MVPLYLVYLLEQLLALFQRFGIMHKSNLLRRYAALDETFFYFVIHRDVVSIFCIVVYCLLVALNSFILHSFVPRSAKLGKLKMIAYPLVRGFISVYNMH